MFTIVTDTSSNLATPLLKSHGIVIIPFTFIVEGKEMNCLDTERFDGHAYYDNIRNGKEVDTSQITPQIYIDYLDPLLADGQDILFISMSSGISGSYSSSCTAVEELKEKYPDRAIYSVDTLSASLAEGMVVLKAVELRDQGVSIDRTVKYLNQYRQKVCQVFTVDDLSHLLRTGRVSAAAAKLGNMLAIKPLLVGDKEGKIVPAGFAKGRKMSFKMIVEKFDDLAKTEPHDCIYIAHADCAQEEIDRLIAMLKEKREIKDVMCVMYEPVTGAHVGPGTVALFYEGIETSRIDLPKMHILQKKKQS